LDLSVDGKYLVSGADDKTVKLWDCSNWKVLGQKKQNKKITNVAFAAQYVDGKAIKQGNPIENHISVIFADKFGDTYIAKAPTLEESTLLLGHIGVITCMNFSLNKDYLITADREEKIRVSCFPKAFKIHQFCLGHRSFISSLTLPNVSSKDILISGGADSTIRVWNFVAGKELCQYAFEGSQEIICSLACSSQNIICALVERRDIVLVFSLEHGKETFSLKLLQKIELEKDSTPLNVYFDSKDNLYVVGSLNYFFELDKNQFKKSKSELLNKLMECKNGQKVSESAIEQVMWAPMRKKTEDKQKFASKRSKPGNQNQNNEKK